MVDYNRVRDLVECEIEKIGKQEQLNETSLHFLDKLVDIRKDIDEIEMNDGIADYYEDWVDGGSSYTRGRNGSSYRRGRSYARGRNGGASYRRGYNGYGNSYSSGNDETIEHLHMAMDAAQTDAERESIRKVIEKMEAM